MGGALSNGWVSECCEQWGLTEVRWVGSTQPCSPLLSWIPFTLLSCWLALGRHPRQLAWKASQSPLDQGLTSCGKVDLVQLKGPCILSLSFFLALPFCVLYCSPGLPVLLPFRASDSKASLPQEPRLRPRTIQESLMPPGLAVSILVPRFLETLTVCPLYLKEGPVPVISL